MEGNAPCLVLPNNIDNNNNNNNNNYYSNNFLSTGYLEDAFLDINLCLKRRRLIQSSSSSNDLLPYHFTDDLSYWNNWLTNYEYNINSEEELSHASVSIHDDDHAMQYSSGEIRTMEDSKKEMCDEEVRNYHPKLKELSSNSKGDIKMKQRRENKTKMVYPMGIVKPGSDEGDLTLHDINRRILMPPTRALKHPVGDFASRSSMVSPTRTGLSGKAVVGLTRIHTRGRGTITIIRTKG